MQRLLCFPLCVGQLELFVQLENVYVQRLQCISAFSLNEA